MTASIRRSIATQEWGTVQGRTSIGHGATSYYTAGHGGLVAKCPDSLPESMRAILRDKGFLIEASKVRKSRKSSQIIRSDYQYEGDDYRGWKIYAHNTDNLLETADILIGEEDCAWSIVVLIFDACNLKLKLDKGMVLECGYAARIETAVRCAMVWYPDVLNALIQAARESGNDMLENWAVCIESIPTV